MPTEAAEAEAAEGTEPAYAHVEGMLEGAEPGTELRVDSDAVGAIRQELVMQTPAFRKHAAGRPAPFLHRDIATVCFCACGMALQQQRRSGTSSSP